MSEEKPQFSSTMRIDLIPDVSFGKTDQTISAKVSKPEPYELAPLQVTASALAVIVPTSGERVLYQQMLLPEGARVELPIRTRPPRGEPKTRRSR